MFVSAVSGYYEDEIVELRLSKTCQRYLRICRLPVEQTARTAGNDGCKAMKSKALVIATSPGMGP
eukprot:6483967-Amphidinium_carterae.1